MTNAKENWLKGINSPNTRKIYGYYFDRLLEIEGLTPEEVLEATKKNLDAYVRLKNAAKQFSEHGRVMAVAALRSFLLDGGIETLPAAHLKVPHRVKPSTYLTWDQAKSVCAAASKPYNMIFNLMLHCGWGITEFLKFNTKETWDLARKYFEKNPNAPYFRFNFAGRKSNENEFYACVPRTFVQEIASLLSVPIEIKSKRNPHQVLDLSCYSVAKRCLESAWRTALKRAPVLVQGEPTPHELRDTFRTRATFVNAAREAAEFVMGHTIDPLYYDKCFHNEAWVWGEINKIVTVEDPEQQIKKSIMQNARMLGLTEEKLEAIQRTLALPISVDALRDAIGKALKELGKTGRIKPTATDGGKTYDALLVDENDLVQYLEMGWELVSVINSKVAIRRPTH